MGMTNSKLYRLLDGSITRYEGAEDKEGVRKVVTYEANGELAGNLVWLNEKEAKALGPKKLEEMHGDVEGAPSAPGQDQGNSGNAKIAAPAAATSLTGAPAGGPVSETEGEEEGESGTGEEESTGGVNVGDAMNTPVPTPSNPAVARVLAKKAADGGNGK